MKSIIIFISIFCAVSLHASEHGIYLHAVADISQDVEFVAGKVDSELVKNGYTVLSNRDISTPDMVREDQENLCGYEAKVIAFTSPSYVKLLTSFGQKYLVAAFMRAGIYQSPLGTQITFANPETINRVIFNDLPEDKYKEIIDASVKLKTDLLELAHNLSLGNNVNVEMEPIRDDEDLYEASRDMFMMVGPMTFFQDEDQFPLIYSQENTNGIGGLQDLLTTINANIIEFEPLSDDIEYRWSPNKTDLNWEIIAEVYSADSSALLLGITRPRTEAVSFRIAGEKREDENNYCPGIDHCSAYPIEVLLISEENKINVYSPREMFRMDMYFWDAGKMAFMNYMQMPGILDESIKKALFKIEDD